MAKWWQIFWRSCRRHLANENGCERGFAAVSYLRVALNCCATSGDANGRHGPNGYHDRGSAHRRASHDGSKIRDGRDIRGTAFMVPKGWLPDEEWTEIDSVRIDKPGRIDPPTNPYAMVPENDAKCSTGKDGASENAAAETKPDVVQAQAMRIMSREERQQMIKNR